MRVRILEGQADITKKSLGDLETLLETEMEKYNEASKVLQEASSKVMNIKDAIASLQREISGRIEVMRKNAPHGTPWG